MLLKGYPLGFTIVFFLIVYNSLMDTIMEPSLLLIGKKYSSYVPKE